MVEIIVFMIKKGVTYYHYDLIVMLYLICDINILNYDIDKLKKNSHLI